MCLRRAFGSDDDWQRARARTHFCNVAAAATGAPLLLQLPTVAQACCAPDPTSIHRIRVLLGAVCSRVKVSSAVGTRGRRLHAQRAECQRLAGRASSIALMRSCSGYQNDQMAGPLPRTLGVVVDVGGACGVRVA